MYENKYKKYIFFVFFLNSIEYLKILVKKVTKSKYFVDFLHI